MEDALYISTKLKVWRRCR